MDNVLLISVGLKKCIFSTNVEREPRNFLPFFLWDGVLCQFTCMPQGFNLSSTFSISLMKPVLGRLRSRGFINVIYIDDILLFGGCLEECRSNVKKTVSLIGSLGFSVYTKKVVFCQLRRLSIWILSPTS